MSKSLGSSPGWTRTNNPSVNRTLERVRLRPVALFQAVRVTCDQLRSGEAGTKSGTKSRLKRVESAGRALAWTYRCQGYRSPGMSSRNWFAVSIIPDGRNETVEGWRYYESEPPEQGAVIEIQTDPANAIGPITRIQVE